METLASFAARCRSVLASDTFTQDATVSVVYAGRPGVDYGSGPGQILASARGGRLMLFTEGPALGEDEDGNDIGYGHAVLYVWPAEWPSLPYLAEVIGAGRIVTLHGADPEDPGQPLLTGEPSDLFVGGFAPPPKAEDLTAEDVYVPLDVLRVLAREERALEAAMRAEKIVQAADPSNRAALAAAQRVEHAASIRVRVARDELIGRLVPVDVANRMTDLLFGGVDAAHRDQVRRELFPRPC